MKFFESFSEKHPKAAQWIREGGLFLIFSYVITFLKYLTNVRMEEAKRLLTEENCTVAKTARKVGYYTSQYFARVFARTVGMKPQEYKKWKEEE